VAEKPSPSGEGISNCGGLETLEYNLPQRSRD
jgi:hypothetical protein